MALPLLMRDTLDHGAGGTVGEWELALPPLALRRGPRGWRRELEWSFPWARPLRVEEDETGIDEELALTLAWTVPGDAGEDAMIGAGSWVVDAREGVAAFAVTVNLFCDDVDLWSRVRHEGRWEPVPAIIHPASATNRARLAWSLRRWELVTGGEIVGWDSDVVDGVERHGFARDAVLRPRK